MLSKSTEYAIRALVFIQLRNWENKRPGVGEIAGEIEAPEAYTAKILQNLTKHQLLNSAKGRGGGFFFDENQSHLTLYQVIHVMEGDNCFHKCGFGLKSCHNDNPCPLHDKYIVVRDGFFEIAKTETISALSDSIRRGDAVLNRIV
ncbi:transcriptional regulator, BadM/Rrf2 family [Saccharicrinis carchari]|uniref:Transcriptional regulator, BadM/Rrf2 family n=1 Tax=Saccharicrinis carchari TaxID=1168039 RepID=A0A521E2D1_SACCC|nr:Rrf2 family transcriptional regulator [Saccharicrinis carchari]SMO77270.1 transcriptional regulator, BadM/Rrf2 family [Saccharicrinis carchari]